jgi:hypothetical protein
MKRLEIRLTMNGGKGSFSSANLGRMDVAGATETCFYVDVPAGSISPVRFDGAANDENLGFTPKLAIFEYGEKGPFWYEVLRVDCVGVNGKCDRAGSDAWVASLRTRKRGRIDPCGSFVVTKLRWDTSGGLAERDNGYYRDYRVDFDLEAKRFATQFAPGSTECVPK